jgi:putative endonuclease
MQTWYVYIVRCADGSFYTGVTTDPQRREREHNECNRLGARYTRARRPVAMVWLEAQPDRSTALKREYQIKQLRRAAKVRLIGTAAASQPRAECVHSPTLCNAADDAVPETAKAPSYGAFSDIKTT